MPLEVDGRRVTVMGLGRFGGGCGVARWLAGRDARVIVTDVLPPEALADGVAALRDLVDAGRIELHLGGHDPADFAEADVVVANPAVKRPWDDPYLTAARQHGVAVTTEIRLLLERLDRRRLIGVTGTAGKSTTAAMIRTLIAGAGHDCRLGGNIGGSLLGDLDSIGDAWIVLELSSFMLHWLAEDDAGSAARDLAPHVAVLTNVAPNHLDWHGSFEHYRRCKHSIFDGQRPDDHRLEADDARSIDPPALRVPGEHNRRNAALAIAAARRVVPISDATATDALGRFGGLAHRLELVAEKDGARFYDDSKSTTPEATALAIAALQDEARGIHLIAGGYDKGASLAPITELASRLAGLYAIGATSHSLAEAAAAETTTYTSHTLERAVEQAIAAMGVGDVLLLSPGCASWDQFQNYEQRGRRYRALVERKLAQA